jgi:beta-lactamase regulating signal transducer with metallopeptidase domain
MMAGPMAQLFTLQFAQASVASILTGCGALALLTLGCRRWPALAQSRQAWLLAQLLAAAAFGLVLAPQSARLSVMPAIELTPAPAPVSVVDTLAPTPAVQAQPPAEALAATTGEAGAASFPWILRATQAWLALYLAGAAAAAVRMWLTHRTLRQVMQGSIRLTEASNHPAFVQPFPRVAILETDLPVSPMLVGVWRPILLLPRHLRDFDIVQQQMIVSHELTHLRRRDPLWMGASIALQTALWFNPALRKLGERLTLAQELGCDQQVLAGRPQGQRKAYAAALVGQLKLQMKLQHGGVQGALAFGGFSAVPLSARIALIRDNGACAFGAFGSCTVVAGFGGLLLATLALQPAFALRIPDAPSLLPELQPIEWRLPLEHPRVSSLFGVVSPLRPSGHKGIDFAARKGTPVLASADGRVVRSTDLDPGGEKYGKTIMIAHANGINSFYAHLDGRVVSEGEFVKAGQQIGRSGATGKVTGPHLHFEVREGNRIVDPASVVPGIDGAATPSARRAHAAIATH